IDIYDEFRKRIHRSSANSEGITSVTSSNGTKALKSSDSHLEGFKSFLLEVSEFYKKLIVKIKRLYGLPEEISSHTRSDSSSISVEPKKMQKCLFLCHRFYVCLGDLARYREQYEVMDSQNHNWSVAVNHYLEATMIWPGGGNPQNQLAVLATYVGDEFLALYHCVRSLAVKEPFPDAWNNLILLLERNRSSHLHSLSTEACFDFSKPSERSSLGIQTQPCGDFSNCNVSSTGRECSLQANLWSLIIRTMSFFFIKFSGLDQFPCTFASTMRVLDAVMELNDTKLKAMLESYQLMDSARTGPFRALQVISIFIFIFHNLTDSSEAKRSEDKKDMQQAELTRLALTTTFIFMGRFADRCLKANPLDSCPLLPAILVFVEWLMTVLDEVERYASDDKVASAISYFFHAFVNLLEQLNIKGEILLPGRTLWEDYELRGFAPLALAHTSLDFSIHWRHADSFEDGIKTRVNRIVGAAMRIADRSSGSRMLIAFNKSRMKFYAAEKNVISGRKEPGYLESASDDSDLKGKAKQPNKCNSKAKEGCKDQILGENASDLYTNGKSVVTEDEEVILFEPLRRHNSAPPNNSVNTKDPAPPKDVEDQPLPSDECLRHATSLLIAQNQAHDHRSTFDFDISNFRGNITFKQQETSSRDMMSNSFLEVPLSAGPPSLNAWVLDQGSLKNDNEKGRSDVRKHSLSPIQELASSSLSGLSLGESEDAVIRSSHRSSTNHFSPPVYSVPVPSAPLLPDDAAWYNGMQSSVPDLKTSGVINRTANFYDASQISAYYDAARGVLRYDSPLPGFMDGYTPFAGLTSSEWLRQYRENHNLIGANSHTRAAHYLAAGPGNFPACNSSGIGLLDKYGTPTDPTTNMDSLPFYAGVLPTGHRLVDNRRENLFNGYQRPNMYGCGAMPDLREDPKPLIQYLKEKEWLLQREQALRGGTYPGN
ncbi:protein SMG7L, partial [Carica papaya]|uniref:protein SMG7L n=1 Tax=Carica papaya TaxID=3649 RepID=UPI000B8CA1F3